ALPSRDLRINHREHREHREVKRSLLLPLCSLCSLWFLFLVVQAFADDSGRAALAVGAATLDGGPQDLATVGLHFGAEAAYHLGVVGPMLSFQLDRFSDVSPSQPSTWFVTMGAGVRGYLARARWPIAVFLDGQGVVA